jgi:hypothetical protein
MHANKRISTHKESKGCTSVTDVIVKDSSKAKQSSVPPPPPPPHKSRQDYKQSDSSLTEPTCSLSTSNSDWSCDDSSLNTMDCFWSCEDNSLNSMDCFVDGNCRDMQPLHVKLHSTPRTKFMPNLNKALTVHRNFPPPPPPPPPRRHLTPNAVGRRFLSPPPPPPRKINRT